MRLVKMASKSANGSSCGAAMKRTSTVKVPPGATSALACPASLLPCCALTRSWKPCTTASLIPSFTYGEGLGTWYSRSTLVSFSVNSSSSGCWSPARTYHQRAPRTACAVEAAPGPMAVIVERGTPGSQVQTLRYHRCGKTWIGAGSGVVFIPRGHGQAEVLLVITKAPHAVL